MAGNREKRFRPPLSSQPGSGLSRSQIAPGNVSLVTDYVKSLLEKEGIPVFSQFWLLVARLRCMYVSKKSSAALFGTGIMAGASAKPIARSSFV